MNIFNSIGSNYDFDYVYHGMLNLFQKNKEKELKVELENKFGGTAILFYKGREAIQAALTISELNKGDFVAINGFTCLVVEQAITNLGLKCEYLDIENDLNFSSQTLEKAIKNNQKIKAVIIQNTLGNLSDFKNIKDTCVKNNLILIEDLAHTTSSVDADFSALSFSQDKAIDAVSGGALIIKNQKYLKNVEKISQSRVGLNQQIKDIFYPKLTFIIRMLYPLGIGKLFHFFIKKLNLLSTPLGDENGKLHFLPRWNTNMALYYLQRLQKINSHRLEISKIYGGNSTNIRYPIFVNDRTGFIRYMKSRGIYLSDVWYDYPVGPKKVSNKSNYKVGTCPNSDLVSSKIVNLPTHINVSKDDALKIKNLVEIWINTK